MCSKKPSGTGSYSRFWPFLVRDRGEFQKIKGRHWDSLGLSWLSECLLFPPEIFREDKLVWLGLP